MLNLLRRLLGRTDNHDVVESPGEPRATPPQTPGTDTQLTLGQLRILRHFRKAADARHLYERADFWTQVGGMPPQRLLQSFVHSGLLIKGNLQDSLSACLTSEQLTDLCRRQGLPVIGSKAAKAKRLADADIREMERLVRGREVYTCTERGLVVVQADLQREKEEKARAEATVLAALEARDFRRACRLVAAYEAEQPIPRGIGIDWSRHDTSGEEEELRLIFSARPGILRDLTDSQLDSLRIPAALMRLWGKPRAREWLPDPGLRYGRFDRDTAARMLMFYASKRRWLATAGVHQAQHRVRILSANDSCPSCRRFEGRTYTVRQAPELPHPDCTHDKGCRCAYVTDFGL